MKVTYWKAFIYADDIMIWGDDVKELVKDYTIGKEKTRFMAYG
jgi:hypothetical protein